MFPDTFCRCREITLFGSTICPGPGVGNFSLFRVAENLQKVEKSVFFRVAGIPVFEGSYVMSEPFCRGGSASPTLFSFCFFLLFSAFLRFLLRTLPETCRIPDSGGGEKREKSHFFGEKRAVSSTKRRAPMLCLSQFALQAFLLFFLLFHLFAFFAGLP